MNRQGEMEDPIATKKRRSDTGDEKEHLLHMAEKRLDEMTFDERMKYEKDWMENENKEDRKDRYKDVGEEALLDWLRKMDPEEDEDDGTLQRLEQENKELAQGNKVLRKELRKGEKKLREKEKKGGE